MKYEGMKKTALGLSLGLTSLLGFNANGQTNSVNQPVMQTPYINQSAGKTYFNFRLQTESGVDYSIQRSSTLTANSWETANVIQGNGSTFRIFKELGTVPEFTRVVANPSSSLQGNTKPSNNSQQLSCGCVLNNTSDCYQVENIK